MVWMHRISGVDALEDLPVDAAMVARLEAAAALHPLRPLAAAAPSFRAYESEEAPSCGRAAFPTFSVTGPACALHCEHCRAEVLKPMIPATSPEMLEARVRTIAAERHLRGFLLSGGSNRRNEIAYERFWPAVRRLKRDLPGIEIAVHSALLDRPRARAMAEAGVDLAMLDIIGEEATIREIYHLDRPVADFEASLDALCAAGLKVAPHIVIGLHRGRIIGEARAIEICLARPIDALVLVVVMPLDAADVHFRAPEPHEIAELFLMARSRAPNLPITLGCARPHGAARRLIDAYAVMAGLDAIAFPADGAVPLARAIGRTIIAEPRCCALGALAREAA